MMYTDVIVPDRLRRGDIVRVIAPSRSLSIIDESIIQLATERLNKLGLIVQISRNAYNIDEFSSSSVADRITDLHEAFEDSEVKGIFTAIGGYNSNQLLDYIDFEFIRKKPKIICGYSDVSVLLNAILTESKIVTYLGPHFSSLGMLLGIDFTLNSLERVLFTSSDFVLGFADYWSDDFWYKNQGERDMHDNTGLEILSDGIGEGIVIGGNMASFNLLRGTKYFPEFDNIILVLEEDKKNDLYYFERKILSYKHLLGRKLKGLLIGRCQNGSKIAISDLQKVADKYFKNVPVICNVDIGHTQPIGIVPLGLICRINTLIENKVVFTMHGK